VSQGGGGGGERYGEERKVTEGEERGSGGRNLCPPHQEVHGYATGVK